MKDAGFSKGLTAASKKMRSFGRGMMVVGAAVTAAGSAIVTPLLAMTRSFVKSGSALHSMSQRTNISVERLQELGYAAEQTGTSLSLIQRAAAKANKEGKNFDEMAAQIAAIQDPVKQTQKAIEVFGQMAGPALVPMLRELPDLERRFRDLGLGISPGAASRADILGNAFSDMKAVVKNARDIIADALAPALTKAVTWLTSIVVRVRDWVRANTALFLSLLKIGGVTVASGVAITGLGASVMALDTVINMVGNSFSFLQSAVFLLMNPVGAVIAAVAVLSYWFVTATKWGQQFVSSLAGWFGDLRDIAVEAFGGIADAFAAGDLVLAAKIAMAGVNLAWLTGTASLREAWAELGGWLVSTWQKIWGGLLLLANSGWANIERGWSHTVEVIGNSWNAFVGGLQVMLNNLVGWFMKAWAFITGATSEELARIDAETAATNAILEGDTQKQIDARKAAAEAARERSRKTQEGATEQIVADTQAKIENVDSGTANKIAAQQAALKAAQDELKALREQAAEQRTQKERKIGDAPEFEPGQFNIDPAKVSGKIFGSFSAAALAGQGGGSGDKTADKVDELKRQEARQHKEMLQAVREGGGLVA